MATTSTAPTSDGQPSRRGRHRTRHATTAGFDPVGTAVERLRAAPDPHTGLVSATAALSSRLGDCSAAILLAHPEGLRVAAACATSLPALLCIDAACDDGACPQACATGAPVLAHHLSDRSGPFVDAAVAAGFSSAYAVPVGGDGTPADGVLLLLAPRPYALNKSTTDRLTTLTDAIAERLGARARANGPDRGRSHEGG